MTGDKPHRPPHPPGGTRPGDHGHLEADHRLRACLGRKGSDPIGSIARGTEASQRPPTFSVPAGSSRMMWRGRVIAACTPTSALDTPPAAVVGCSLLDITAEPPTARSAGAPGAPGARPDGSDSRAGAVKLASGCTVRWLMNLRRRIRERCACNDGWRQRHEDPCKDGTG